MLLSDVATFCSTNSHGRSRVKSATVNVYKTAVSRLILFFDDIPAEEIDEGDLQDWQKWLDANGETNVVTDNTYKRTVRSLWRYMKKRGLEVCDVTGIFEFKKELKGVKSISARNARKMLAFTGIRETAIILMANESACRRGGLASMTVSATRIWYEEELGEYVVMSYVTEKGDKPHVIVGFHRAALAMQLWLDIRNQYIQDLGIKDHGYVFINLRDGSPQSAHSMSANNSRIKQKANIPKAEPCNLHAHRHHRAKELLKVHSLDFVRDVLGHNSVETTANQYAVRGVDEVMEELFRVRKNGRS